ncbi:MAG: hypothetical protein HDR90_04260 [Bacteroides sp.]|nr:hypothetical protein [Bacteroides sp.]
MKRQFYSIAGAAIALALSGLEAYAQDAEYTAPVKLEINSQEAFDQWTNINPSGDANYDFHYNSTDEAAEVAQNQKAVSDYWLVSPAVNVTAGTTYNITIYAKNVSSFSSDKSAIKLYAGDAPEVDALTTQIFSNENLNSKYFTTTDNTGTYTATATGPVYFGIHVVTKSYAGGTAIQYLDIEKVAATPGTPTDLSIVAGEKGALSATITWKQPDVDKFGGTLSDLTGAYVYRGSTSFFSVNESNLVGTVAAPTPGQEVTWTDESVPSSGTFYYRIAAYNSEGTGAACTGVESPYIGMATSVPGVTDVIAEPVPDSNTSVTLTFTQPAPTNGYFDPADVAYKITRSSNGNTVTLADAWQGQLPYIDDTITELGSYEYQVYTVFNGSTSFSGAKSNKVVTGGCATLPYSNDFSSASSIELFTLFHTEDGKRDWNVSSSALNYWGSPADAYACLPKFNLKKGKAYELTFATRVNTVNSPKNLGVNIGLVPTADGLSEQLWTETISSAAYVTVKQIFSVQEDGEYYIAFHCFGPSDSNDLYVDDLSIAEVVATPKPVTDLKATPAAAGELKVALSWINSSETTAGETLDIIEKIEVLRGSDVVATLENLAGGAEGSYEDTVDEAGIYSYSIIPYLGEEAGEATEVTSAWVGYDIPKAPETVEAKAVDNGVEVTFTEVTEGVNGGYVDPAKIVYIVKRNDDTLTDDCTASPFVDEDTELPLAIYTYSVAASDGENTSEYTDAPAIKLGDAIELPFTPDLADASIRDLFTISKNPNTGRDQWTWNSSKGAMECGASNAVMITPPLDMDAGEISVKWKATCYNARYTEDFQILLCKNDDPADLDIVSIIDTPHVESVSFPSVNESKATVYDAGRYYIAFRQETNNWSLYIYQTDVEQMTVTTGIDTVNSDDNTAIAYADGYVTVPGAGVLTVYNPAGNMVATASTDGRSVAVRLVSGVYIAAWQGADGSASTAKIFVK